MCLLYLQSELESRPKSSRPRPRRDIDVARPRQDRDFEQKLETRLERSETETRLLKPNVRNIFDTKFWTFGQLPNTLQYNSV